MTSTTTSTTQADDLRRLADLLDRHPNILLSGGDRLFAWADTPEQMADATKALADGAAIGDVTKNFADNYVTVERTFGPVIIAVLASRSKVCEQVVVGTEVVHEPVADSPQAKTVAELEAQLVAARAAVPTVPVERDKTEWICQPLLSAVTE